MFHYLSFITLTITSARQGLERNTLGVVGRPVHCIVSSLFGVQQPTINPKQGFVLNKLRRLLI